MMRNPKATVLVLEDDPPILRGLLDVLVFNGYEPTGVEDGGEALEKALHNAYDILLLDVMVPTMDGFTVCREIRKCKPTQPVIMLTAKGAEDDIITGFKAGADDYVTKPFSLRELLVRLEALLRRAGKNLGDEKATIQGILFDGSNLTAAFQGQVVEFTRREMDIVLYLNRNRDRIVSKQVLLAHVWNYADTDIETRTVDIHMLKLRKKIASLIGDEPFIQTIRGEGYRLC